MMDMFYRLDPYMVRHSIWHRVKGDSEWDKINAWDTQKFGESFPLLTIQCMDTYPLPDMFKSGSKPIISKRFKELFETFNVRAEYLPINVLAKDGEPVEAGAFWYMHMLQEIDCIDYDNSVFEPLSEHPDSPLWSISKLSFTPKTIGDLACFRPKRYAQLFVSKLLQEAILSQRISVDTTSLEEAKL